MGAGSQLAVAQVGFAMPKRRCGQGSIFNRLFQTRG